MKELIDIKKKYEFLNVLILGFFLIIIGFVLILQTRYYSLIFSLAGLLIVTFKKGILVDTENKRIKRYKKIAFKTTGKWEDFSNINYIALIRVNLTQKMNAVTIPGNFSDVQVKLNFVMNDKKIIPLYTDRRNKVIPLSEKIAKGFNVDIFDNSEGKKQWIKYK